MAVGRIGADHHDDVGLRRRDLKSCVPAEVPKVLRQAIAGGRVADAGAGVDVVVAEGGADHLLHDVDFLVGAARRGDAADGAAAVLLLDRLEARGGIADRLVPGHLAPRIGDPLADHRLGDAVLVGGVAPGEAALDAGMALVGAAVLVGHHADDLVALHLGLEGAADAAIGAGGDDASAPAGRCSMTDFSVSVAVGQACTQAPQETHSESRKSSSMPAETCEAKPRPSMVSAKVPCTSSQARTQREQTMHLAGSKVK